LVVLVVGNTKEFDKPLSTLGPVKEIDITIPPPPGAKEEENEKPTASNEEGMALASKVVAALGGESKLAAIKSLKEQLTITQQTPQGDFPMQMETIIVFPDRLHAEMQAPNGTMDIVVTPNEAFAALPGGNVQNLPESQKAETLEQIKRDPVFIGSHLKDPNVFFHASGTEKVGDIEARIVDVNASGAAIRWFVDPQSGRILKETYGTLSQGRPVQGETDMDNWKPIAGLILPLTRHNKQNGQETSTAEIKALELNPTVDAKLFTKPPQQPAAKP
jgi:outer membrane lipoprotein-sorting protein